MVYDRHALGPCGRAGRQDPVRGGIAAQGAVQALGQCAAKGLFRHAGGDAGAVSPRGLWLAEYSRPNRNHAGYAAFAQSGTGDVGYSYAAQTAAQAEADALSPCRNAVRDGLSGLTEDTRKVMHKIGATSCKVVFRDGP